ncbi:hypothetical protein REPUB_Repub06bG0165000 [Reevesia pubescens]
MESVSWNRGYTTVYVNNIPPTIHWRWLWMIFQNQGKVVDVYIPQKRNLNGRKFGFVRFREWNDANRAVSALNGAWLFDFCLTVSFAKSNSRSSYGRKFVSSDVGSSSRDEEKPQSRKNFECKSTQQLSLAQALTRKKSYANALIGTGAPAACTPVTDPKLPIPEVKQNEAVDATSEDSLDLALANRPSCLGVVDEEAIHKLENCLVGVARDYYETGSLMENFRMSGVFDVSVKKISGRQFLIEFEDIDLRNKMEEQNWTWLKEWFVELENWSVFSYAKYRTTWLTIFGLPLHIWNHATFHNIANIWGEIISFDSKTFNFQDFSRGAMLIMTNQLKKIDEVITLKGGGEMFPVRVSEVGEDVISFFHCCHDSFKAKNKNVGAIETTTCNSNSVSLTEKECPMGDHQSRGGCYSESTCRGITSPYLEGAASSSSKTLVSSPAAKGVSGAALSEELVPETEVASLEIVSAAVNPKFQNGFVPSEWDSEPPLIEGPASSSSSPLVENCGLQDVLVGSASALGLTNPIEAPNSLTPVEDQLETDEVQVPLASSKALKNKRGSKSIADIEDQILASLDKKGRRRGRKKKNIFRLIPPQLSEPKIVNSSLSDSDFLRRRQRLCKEATATWALGKALGLSANCDDEVIISELLKRKESEQICSAVKVC